MILELSNELRQALPQDRDLFEWFLAGHGTVHREVKNRLTYEMRLGDTLHVYVKRQLGCGWKEVLKEWYRLRKPVVSARTEWEAAATLTAAGVRVPRVIGQGERGRYPHAIESFVVLDALENCETLEHFKPGWLGQCGSRWVALKRSLIEEVARISRTMHGQGINHRDFYINHFLINRDWIHNWHPGQAIPLTLIDLHRVQQRPQLPCRWRRKDLAALLFSALDVGLTSTDCIRYVRSYLGPTWKACLRGQRALWRAVIKRACQLYQSFHGKSAHVPAILKL